MRLVGHIENGRVVLDEPIELPEGAEVRLEILPRPAGEEKEPGPRPAGKTFYERFEHLIGTAENLPPDVSIQLDHYLYGLPKQEP